MFISKMKFKAIAAMSRNRVIGCNNKIPWNIPDELKWFKEKTTNGIVVMGRSTFESIGSKALPNREMIIISHNTNHPNSSSHVQLIDNIDKLFELKTDKPIWICGGSKIYEQLLPFCSELFITMVKRDIDGDTYFPEFEKMFNSFETIKDTPEYKIVHCFNSVL